MSFTVNRTNSEELNDRKADLTKRLVEQYAAIEGQPITRRDLRDLASMGCLSIVERNLYDELRRVEMMLDIDE